MGMATYSRARLDDHGINPNDFSVILIKGPPLYAWIDGGIGLNKIFISSRPQSGAAFGTDPPTVTVCSKPNGLPIAIAILQRPAYLNLPGLPQEDLLPDV